MNWDFGPVCGGGALAFGGGVPGLNAPDPKDGLGGGLVPVGGGGALAFEGVAPVRGGVAPACE